MYGRVFFVALGLVGAIGAAAIYGVGGHLVVSGDLTAGTLVAMAALVTRVYQPLTGLTNARVDLMTSLVSFERVFEVLDAPEAITERPGAIDLVDPAGRVTFDDVRFRYPPAADTSVGSLEMHAPAGDPDRDVLDGLSLDVAPGETVALVGVSGAGKSTLAVLIPRLYDVTGGRRAHRRPRRPRPHARLAASGRRRRRPGPAPVPRVDRRQPALRHARTRRPTSSSRRAGRRRSSTPSPRSPTASTPSSATAATACRAARSSAWRSPACCSRIRP